MKSGFIGIVGRPNVGKSTLINEIVGQKVAIVSDKAGTTRNNIQGIYNEEDTQIVFVDTPGIHKPKHRLGYYLNKEAYYSINDVDAILFLIDVKEPFGRGDEYILTALKNASKPVILVLTKIDKLTKEELLPLIGDYSTKFDFAEIVPISALKGDNVSELINTVKKYLTDDVKYFPDDQKTNRSLDFLIAEIVREKVFHLTNQEVPHSVTCIVERRIKDKNKYIIDVLIIVDRDSLKRIIVGNKGKMIKEIGTRARVELETMLNGKVYLNLFVKVIKKWREKDQYLKDFGYIEEK